MKNSVLRVPLCLTLAALAGGPVVAGPAPAVAIQEAVEEREDPLDWVGRRVKITRYIINKDKDEAMITRPLWLETPSPQEIRTAWPVFGKGDSGEVTLRCQVTELGRLARCRTIRESPAGHGFSSVALRLTSRFKLEPPSEPAPTLGGYSVDVPFRFTPPTAGAAAVKALDWEVLPTHDQMTRALRSANLSPTGARATLSCTVGAAGQLDRCRVGSESQSGVGRALASVASSLKVGLWSPDGLPTRGARVNIPISVE